MAGHYYTLDGQARHGAKRAEIRAEGLLPSVTTVMADEITNPFLDRWKLGQLLMASMTLPKVPGETEDDRIERI